MQADIDGTRYKRESVLPTLGYAGNEELNELSHRVMRSIEAVLASDQDNGNCLRRVLCDDNKQSRENNGGIRIWVPVWRSVTLQRYYNVVNYVSFQFVTS